jgi:CheY-like chemotaxis protein
MTRVTVVNDNPDFLALMRDILEDERYETTTIDGDRADAMERISASRPQLLMIDLRMGADGIHGWDIAQQVRREPEFDGLPLLLCSGDLESLEALAPELADAHHVEVLKKPFGVDQLCDTVDRLLASTIGG